MTFSLFIFYFLLFTCLCIYCILILAYRKWFKQLQVFTSVQNVIPKTYFTIIIPARNEEENIGKCVNGILQQNYPALLFEIIVIDDYSTDATPAIINELQKQYGNLRLLSLADVLQGQINSYKKKAIEMAVGQASGDWIITTDADCFVTSEWLQQYDAYIQQHNAVFVAAPVSFIHTGSFVSLFQYMDFMSLQGITAAAVSAGMHSMCNGANLAYNKKVFYEAGGFSGIDNIASGDDMLLMHKIKQRYPKQIGYLFSQNAIVQTLPMPDWKSFLNQRIRWASKADKYDDKAVTVVLVLVYLLNLMLFISLFLCLLYPHYFIYWLGCIAIKTIVELTFMFPVASFFKGTKYMKWFPLMQPLHVAYTVSAGFLGKFGKYQWKGRQVK